MNEFERSELMAASRIAISVLDQAAAAVNEYASEQDRDAAAVALVTSVVEILYHDYAHDVQ